jgi:hypothetical protein
VDMAVGIAPMPFIIPGVFPTTWQQPARADGELTVKPIPAKTTVLKARVIYFMIQYRCKIVDLEHSLFLGKSG